MTHPFPIPIALFFFKREEKTCRILERICAVRPQRIYLLGDYGRNDEEIAQVEQTRRAAEQTIHRQQKTLGFDCEIARHYVEENVGVYGNIALGTRRVFEQESRCIFLEDDNLPNLSFFPYCREMLERYEHEEKILWVCGTNYLSKQTMDARKSRGDIGDFDAFFTQLNLPCGWASWSRKFLKWYDPDMSGFDVEWVNQFRPKVPYPAGYLPRYKQAIRNTYQLLLTDKKRVSWDFQMLYALWKHDLYGIMPFYNQITNIGDDESGTHTGHRRSFSLKWVVNRILAKRFLQRESHALPGLRASDFGIQDSETQIPNPHSPLLALPEEIQINTALERLVAKQMVPPGWARFMIKSKQILKQILKR